MVIKLVLTDKLPQNKPIISRYKKYTLERVKGFHNTEIKFIKLRNYDNRMEISIKGPEEVFIKNLLQKEIGSIYDFNVIEKNMLLKGNLVDVGNVGFGLFVDCAILNPKVDVLVSLNTLREQLCKGKERSLPEIVKAYDFINGFPVSIKITSIDSVKENIKGILDKETLNLYQKLLKERLEAVFLSGETKSQLKKALEKTHHIRDIISINKYGFLQNLIVLKEDTEAPGIISDIGKYLKKCKLSAIRPERINKLCE
ncbi:MAG: DUF2110 family protein [Promethearchaeota archaeon]|nr:MAG: DUF2110 family protein [Candidatus Lokiarchaeota archaeon]